MRQQLFGSVIVAALMAAPPARATQYLMTVQSTFHEDDSESGTFDGMNYGTVPFYPLDNGRLAGGTMVEHFILSDVTPVTLGVYDVEYDFAQSAGWTYDLYDAGGLLVHHGSGSSGGAAYVQNDEGGGMYAADQVLVYANFDSVTNLFNPTADLSVVENTADVNCFGYVGGGVDFLHDLSLPLDGSVYTSFPANGKITDVIVELGSGDTTNFVDPYAYTASFLVYDVESVSIVGIPEPSAACLASVALTWPLAQGRRRGR